MSLRSCTTWLRMRSTPSATAAAFLPLLALLSFVTLGASQELSSSSPASTAAANAPLGLDFPPSATSGGVAAGLATDAFMSPGQNGSNDEPCLPQDFIRSAGQCTEGEATYDVVYSMARRCTPVFSIQGHKEPCGCRPDDLMWFFQKTDGDKCSKIFKCGQKDLAKYEVDSFHCKDMIPACQADMLQTKYGKCDYIKDKKTGQRISERQAVEVIYYFDHTCDPNAYGAYPAPASAFIPCDTSCGSGSYLAGAVCKQCPAGSFSQGGMVKYDKFDSIDPNIFKTSCTYKNPVPGSTTSMETVNCTQGWYAEDLALEVGQFDLVNQWFPEECEADPERDCHNNLEAVISMDVDLVTEGYVKFNFSVNSEKGHDGLSFYIDTREEAILGLQSYEVVPRSVLFYLMTGRHTLYWVYSKDSHFTQGEDIAVIHSIEISGLGLNALECKPCPKGTYSAGGASECLPCPVNSIAINEGQLVCDPCKETEYSVSIPRVQCLPKPACNLTKDYVKVVGKCNTASQNQTVVWRPTLPQVCLGGDVPAPQQIPCEACKAGFQAVNTPGGTTECHKCSPGQTRSEQQASCVPCPSEMYAALTWSLKAFDFNQRGYPPGITSYCHGACGTSGWRKMTDYMDSGRHHGDGTQVIMVLNTTLSSEGSVYFNYSVDMSAGAKLRGFYFYVDDNIIDFVQEDEVGSVSADSVRESGPWELTPGNHKLVWEWVRISGDAAVGARDSTIIYDIVVKGSTDGVASTCEAVPPGYFFNQTSKGIQLCPAGTFNEGVAANCTLCPVNTISAPGSSVCSPCGAGTSSKPGDAECFIGAAYDLNSFCTFLDLSPSPLDKEESITGSVQNYFYDLSALNRMSLVHPFGPVHEAGADPGSSAAYYINVCNRDSTNNTCHDVNGKSLNTYACMVHPEKAKQAGHPPALELGKKLEVHSLSEYGEGLSSRGVLLSFEGDTCPKNALPRRLNITLICSPQSGYGLPSHWTADGKAAAFDPAMKTPEQWTVQTGAALPIEDKATCSHDMVWYSKIACHECSWMDYDEIRINNCKNNTMYIYRWKEEVACLPTEKIPLPPNIRCQPCTADDYIEQKGTCTDIMGNQNITYRWSQPKLCSDDLLGAVPLPPKVLAGTCVQEFFFVPSKYVSPKYVFIFAALAVGLIVALTVCLVAYIKHKRLESVYAKIAGLNEQITEMVDLDDHDREDGEHTHLQG